MNRHIVTIGRITLKKQYEFTQYSECAAWTDYVTCQPQTVDLKRYDDGYWVGGAFDGTLTRSTFPSGDRHVGEPAKACFQTQSFGGIGDWMDCELYSIEITNPAFEVYQASTYSNGRPMLALRRTEPVTS